MMLVLVALPTVFLTSCGGGDDDDSIPGGSSGVTKAQAVDLGLPSRLKWASMNVGATTPEGYGDYFSWGETTPKASYSFENYKWLNFIGGNYTKYILAKGFGEVDNKYVLDPEDDAAQVNMKGTWRMPTQDEIKELFNNCDWKWTNQKGVNGIKFTSKNGNGKSIFLPAAGYRKGATLLYAGEKGYYASNTLQSTTDFYGVAFGSAGEDFATANRCQFALTVRAVCR